MTVQELIQLLSQIDGEVSVKSSKGEDYESVVLFLDTQGNVCMELE